MINEALLKALWQQSRVWLIAILLIVLGCAAVHFYRIGYQQVEMQQLAARHADLQNLLKSRQANLSKSGVPLSEVEKMESELGKFLALIPAKQNFSEFLGELFSWAKKNDLNIRQISYRPELDKETGFLKYGLGFSVQGSYSQLKKFIYDMESSKRVMIIDSISLAGNQGAESGVSLRINLATYFREVAQ